MSDWKGLPPIKIGNPKRNKDWKMRCTECHKAIDYMPTGNICNECWERHIDE